MFAGEEGETDHEKTQGQKEIAPTKEEVERLKDCLAGWSSLANASEGEENSTADQDNA